MQSIEPKIDIDRIYTPDDAAEVFQVAPGTIRRLVRQGNLAGFYVGAYPRMTGAQLLEFVAAGGARFADQPDEYEPAADPSKITSDAPALAESVAA